MPHAVDRRPKILLVDDDLLILTAVDRLLASQGYAVTTARSAAEALDRLAEQPFDLVLSDHWMEGMSGQELLRRLVVERPGIRRVLMSGTLCHVELPCPALDAVVEKPWETSALLRTLGDLLPASPGGPGAALAAAR
jgi:CheY-like chemotaxis protein